MQALYYIIIYYIGKYWKYMYNVKDISKDYKKDIFGTSILFLYFGVC